MNVNFIQCYDKVNLNNAFILFCMVIFIPKILRIHFQFSFLFFNFFSIFLIKYLNLNIFKNVDYLKKLILISFNATLILSSK